MQRDTLTQNSNEAYAMKPMIVDELNCFVDHGHTERARLGA